MTRTALRPPRRSSKPGSDTLTVSLRELIRFCFSWLTVNRGVSSSLRTGALIWGPAMIESTTLVWCGEGRRETTSLCTKYLFSEYFHCPRDPMGHQTSSPVHNVARVYRLGFCHHTGTDYLRLTAGVAFRSGCWGVGFCHGGGLALGRGESIVFMLVLLAGGDLIWKFGGLV